MATAKTMKPELQVDLLYRAYPRHVAPRRAKQQIVAALHRLKRVGTIDPYAYLLGRVGAYAASPAGATPAQGCADFRPYPATWFSQERYCDDPAEWERSGSTLQPPAAESEVTQRNRAAMAEWEAGR